MKKILSIFVIIIGLLMAIISWYSFFESANYYFELQDLCYLYITLFISLCIMVVGIIGVKNS